MEMNMRDFNLININHSFNSKSEQTAHDNVQEANATQSDESIFMPRTNSQTSVAHSGVAQTDHNHIFSRSTQTHSWLRDILVGVIGAFLGGLLMFIFGIN